MTPDPVARDLSKGQNTPLESDGQPLPGIRVAVTWTSAAPASPDVSALLLGADGRVRSDADLVFYNQPVSVDGAVRALGPTHQDETSEDRLIVALEDVADDVRSVVVLASMDGDTPFPELQLVVSSLDEQPLLVFRPTGVERERALVLVELYRRDTGWRCRAVGQGYDSGLAGVATDYGIDVAEQTADAVQASESTPALDDPVALPIPPTLARTQEVQVRRKRAAPPVRALTLGEDDSWRAARLFSIVGIGGADEQERRATSALLSVLMGVKEFGRAVTGRLGAPAGVVETYLEVPFPLKGSTVIPDGVLRVQRAGRIWTALVEVKTGSSPLERAQVESYLDVARLRGYDAVVTISNELPPTAGQHPVGVDRRKLAKVSLHHISWAEVVHEGTMQLAHRGVADLTQGWLLSELLRYLRHPRSGASGFEDMGSAWVPVRDAVLAGTLRAADKRAGTVAGSWERLARQVALRKSGELGVDVTVTGARKHAADPAARLAAVVAELVGDGSLSAGLRIPGAIGPLTLTADVRLGRAECSVDVKAPADGRPATRVGWLVRQLADAPGQLRVDAVGQRADDDRSALLSAVRADASVLGGPHRTYRLVLSEPLGTKRGVGRGGFITSVHTVVDTFYRDVVQGLRPWTPPAPKLPAHDAAEAEDVQEAT